MATLEGVINLETGLIDFPTGDRPIGTIFQFRSGWYAVYAQDKLIIYGRHMDDILREFLDGKVERRR